MKGKVSLVGSAMIAIMAASGEAYAQDQGMMEQASPGSTAASTTQAPTSESAGAGEIVVTAQKRAQSINRVPMSITAASGDQLKTQGIKDVSDLVKITPGFSAGLSNTGTPVYTLRGVGYNDVALAARPAVTVYLDEAALPFAMEAQGAGFDVERVEVLKGPQGTLFGNNSTGGAINYIANKPTSELAFGGNFTYGRFNEADIDGYVSGPITSTLNARLAVQHLGHGDWQKSYTRNDSMGKQDFTNGRLILAWNPSPDLRAQLTLVRWVDQSDMQASQLIRINPSIPSLIGLHGLENYPLAAHNNRAADWDPNRSFERNNNLSQATLRLDYDVSDAWTATSLTNFVRLKVNQDYDGSGTAVVDDFSIYQFGKSTTVSQEFRLAGKTGSLSTVAGVTYTHDLTTDTEQTNIAGATLSNAFVGLGAPVWTSLQGRSRQEDDIFAVFGNAELNLTSKLAIQGGIRFTQSNLDAVQCSADNGDGNASAVLTALLNNGLRAAGGLPPVAAPGAGNCTSIDPATLTFTDYRAPLHEHNVSWRTGVQYQASPGTILYANVSKGYKGGSFSSVGGVFSTTYIPTKQESVLAYEAGFKTKLFDRAVQMNGAAFYYDYRDKQVLGTYVDAAVGPIARLVNVPKARIYGGELQITATPLTGLSLSAAGSYIKSEILGHYTDTNVSAEVQDFNGTALPFAPKWQLTGNARYEWPLDDHLKGFAAANVTYQSVSYGLLGEVPIAALKPYSLTDLQAGIASSDGKWRGYVWGRNVFDNYYVASVIRVTDLTTRAAGMPATYGFTLAFNY